MSTAYSELPSNKSTMYGKLPGRPNVYSLTFQHCDNTAVCRIRIQFIKHLGPGLIFFSEWSFWNPSKLRSFDQIYDEALLFQIF